MLAISITNGSMVLFGSSAPVKYDTDIKSGFIFSFDCCVIILLMPFSLLACHLFFLYSRQVEFSGKLVAVLASDLNVPFKDDRVQDSGL